MRCLFTYLTLPAALNFRQSQSQSARAGSASAPQSMQQKSEARTEQAEISDRGDASVCVCPVCAFCVCAFSVCVPSLCVCALFAQQSAAFCVCSLMVWLLANVIESAHRYLDG